MENVRVITPKRTYSFINDSSQEYTYWNIPKVPYDFIVSETKQKMRREFIDVITNAILNSSSSLDTIHALLQVRNRYEKDFEETKRINSRT